MSDAQTPSNDGTESTHDDVKAKMKDALDKKHAVERAGEAHLSGSAKAGATHGKSGGPQQFRRKAGG